MSNKDKSKVKATSNKTSQKKTSTNKTSKKNIDKSEGNRQRKLLRDNISGLTKPAFRRILQRAGVKRVNGLIYEELRGITKAWLEKIIRDMVIFTEHARRKTAMLEDLEGSLSNNGIMLAAGLNENAKRTASLQSCNSRGKGKGGSEKESKKEGAKKPHRFRPGTVAVRNIKKQQKASDCLAIPKLCFSRFVRELAQDHVDNLRFAEGVFDILQLAAEDHLVKLCRCANAVAIHAGRETLFPRDLQLIQSIRADLV